ncbi:YkgJ family cysteine cluster protein [Desulforhopalus singaporensis]|uniref:YkgJ family cysteine cluster protein n=1 Tax=Desulforhopalus singaporensis TaxID=91360 RepID=A0A1H0L6X0_9BACT|nr:YkgJ family cysteine cluster protein [Desulforhopalus singaporensis]SDO63967.1 hypothetical protein SAMN05660330_00689 [Desulforhopalus singaporensis]
MVYTRSIQATADDLSTWTKYRKKLCGDCLATCCTLPVEVKVPDLVRMELVDKFEQDGNIKQVARRLKKEKLIDHYHHRSGTFTLSRMASGDCLYLHPDTRRCTIYQKRPDTCRNHPQVGPRPGFCPFLLKESKRGKDC